MGPRGHPWTPGVIPIGWVGDETLPGLFAAASFFLDPSPYEGFGLPPLEAMAAGTPVAAGRYSAAPEVLGDSALLIEPHYTTAWTEAIVRLAEDQTLRRSLARAGRTNVAGFSWQSTGAATETSLRFRPNHVINDPTGLPSNETTWKESLT